MVVLENGEIVRVERSARNQRPHVIQSDSGSNDNSSRIFLNAAPALDSFASKTPRAFKCCPATASARRGNHSGVRLLTGIKSQTLAVRSFDAVMICLPSGLKRAEVTSSSCLSGSVEGVPLRAAQILAEWSFDAVTIHLPSGENCAELMGASCCNGCAIGWPLLASQTRAV